jgi:hypothetical protein
MTRVITNVGVATHRVYDSEKVEQLLCRIASIEKQSVEEESRKIMCEDQRGEMCVDIYKQSQGTH